MEDFAKPENYQGNDLFTIKNLAERIRLEKGKGSTLGDLRKKELFKEKSQKIKTFVQLPRVSQRQPNFQKKDQKTKISDYSKLIKQSSNKKSKKRESLLIDIDQLKISEIESIYDQQVNLRKSIPSSRIIFGLVYNTKTEMEIKKRAIKLFKWAGRMVLIWMNYFNLVTEKSQHREQNYFGSLKSQNETEDFGNMKEFQFNKHHFRATKEIDLTVDMQKTLTIPPKERTEDQINSVMYGLAPLEAFNEYPIHLKKRLCNVAYYKRVDPHRVIIRQGHQAEYFYFIISGTSIVTITDNGVERKVNSLVKGCSFGELALLHHSKRTASVVSTSAMQLLAIERNDFFQIFMHIESGLSKYPEHVAFIKDIPIFRHLNAENLVKYTESCLCHFYKKGSVICTNDRESEWVYIVKSGSCTIIKEIKVPINGNPMAQNTLSLHDLESKIQCYEDYYFIPTPLDDATGNAKSKTRYLWRSPTLCKPGDYFYLKNELAEDDKIEMQIQGENKINSSKSSLSVFIELAHMASKDFYGLSSVIFAEEDKLRIEDMASIAMISNRAEVVLISKKYLIQNSCEELIKDVRQGISQYPSDEIFLETYQTRINWEKYKTQSYKSTIKNINK